MKQYASQYTLTAILRRASCSLPMVKQTFSTQIPLRGGLAKVCASFMEYIQPSAFTGAEISATPEYALVYTVLFNVILCLHAIGICLATWPTL